MARSRRCATKLILALCGLLAAAPAAAVDWDLRVEGEARYFYHGEDPKLAPSAAATLELFQGWRDDKRRLVLELFARENFEDAARSHSDLREFYFQYIGKSVELAAGNRRVYWGVTESRHLVDIINQSDFVEDLDNEAKLGQPMVNVSLIRGLGTLDLFVMPYQRARTFPGPDGHPRLPFPIAADEALYESDRGQAHVDFALRYRHAFGPLDLGLAWFNGTAREPQLLPCLKRGSGFRGTENGPNCDIFSGIDQPQPPFPAPVTQVLLSICALPTPPAFCLLPDPQQVQAGITAEVFRNLVLVPYYERLRQASLDAQYVVESLALKLEAVYREQGGDSSYATVSGFEYTFGDVGGSGWDIGVLGEYLQDTRDNFLASRADHDWFAGTRWALNDIADSQMLAGVIFDSSGKDQTYQIEASRRVGDDWKVLTKIRHFEAIPDDSLARFLDDEDMISLTLERYF